MRPKASTHVNPLRYAKRCPVCRLHRPACAFGLDASRDDGHAAVCRSCRGRTAAVRRARPQPCRYCRTMTPAPVCEACQLAATGKAVACGG